jgi:histone H3/H4
MTDRKVGRRDAIALAPCHRLVKEGAGKLNVSDLAGKAAKKAVKNYLKHVAEKSSAHAQEHGKKTVNLDMVVKAATRTCSGVSENDVRRGHQGGEKGLAKAGVVRQFQKHCKLRVTEEAKQGLLAAAEAYCRSLGMRGSMMVKSAKRKTVLARDLDAAERLSYV